MPRYQPPSRTVPRPAILRPEFGRFDWTIAVHEASHAVAALVLGGCVESVVLANDKGFVTCDGLSHRYEKAVMYIAGAWGVALLTDSPDPFRGAFGDYEQASRLVNTAELAAVAYEAERLILRHRAAIGRVATEAARRGYLDGNTVSLLFNLNN